MFNSIEMPSVYFLSLAEWQNRRMFLARIAEYLEITALARIAECLEIKIVSAFTWISFSIKFVVLRRRSKRNPGQNFTMACHMQPTEKYSLVKKEF